MKPYHTTMVMNIGVISMMNKPQVIGALGFAAALLATTTMPAGQPEVFDIFSKKITDLTKDNDVGNLIALTETLGQSVKEHIGNMDLPTATFFKGRLDSLRDQVAFMAPHSLHNIDHAIYAVRSLDQRIQAINSTAGDAAEQREAA